MNKHHCLSLHPAVLVVLSQAPEDQKSRFESGISWELKVLVGQKGIKERWREPSRLIGMGGAVGGKLKSHIARLSSG